MSFTIPAKLNVIERHGKNGAFMVAELITDIGKFDVKNRVLEQFQEGVYEGLFTLTRIYIKGVSFENGTWTKLCADLDWEALRIMVQSEEPLPSTDMAAAEMLQAEEEKPEPAQTESGHTFAGKSEQTAFSDEDLVSDMGTLREKMSRSERIKFDGTMEDRNLFRQLRDEVRAGGYRFDGNTQSWYPA